MQLGLPIERKRGAFPVQFAEQHEVLILPIAVVGSGYVGLVAAACFAEIGHDVISIDNDAEKIAQLQQGEVPIHEEHLPELLDRHRGKRFILD